MSGSFSAIEEKSFIGLSYHYYVIMFDEVSSAISAFRDDLS